MEKVTKILLDKLYDVIGEDSSILKNLSTKRTEEESKIELASKEIEKLAETVSTNENKLNAYNTTGQDAVDKLKKFNDDEATIIMEITEDKKNNIMELSKKATESLPKMIELVTAAIEKAKNEKAASIDKKETALNNIKDLDLKYEEAERKIKEFNKVIESAINGELNATRGDIVAQVKDLGDFTDEEAIAIAKEILFPEDNLKVYLSEKKAAEAKSLKAVMSEAKEQANDAKEVSVIEPVTTTMEKSESEELTGLSAIEEAIEASSRTIQAVKEEINQDVKDYLMKELHRKEFDIINNESCLKNVTVEQLINNNEKLKSVGIDPRNMPIAVLVDPDKLISVLEKLQEFNVELDSKEIERNAKVLIGVNTEEIASVVKVLPNTTKPNGKTEISVFRLGSNELNKVNEFTEEDKAEVKENISKVLLIINYKKGVNTNNININENDEFTVSHDENSWQELDNDNNMAGSINEQFVPTYSTSPATDDTTFDSTSWLEQELAKKPTYNSAETDKANAVMGGRR